MTLEAINKKGYEFISYSKENTSISENVHELMNSDSYFAMTFKDTKKIYIKDELLIDGKEESLLGTLTNEAVHIVLDPTDTVEEAGEVFGRDVTSMDMKDEITQLKSSDNYTNSELILQLVLNEEILSQVVEDIVVEKYRNKDYKFFEKDLDRGEYSIRLTQIKFGLSAPVLSRIFDLSQVEEKDLELLLKRTNRYMSSGAIEKYLLEKLKEY